MIQTQSYDSARLFATGALFSDEFEDRRLYVYHGTSSIYASGIEANGLSPTFTPVTPDELRSIAESLPPESDAIREVLQRHGNQPTRIGFAAYSFSAIDYALNGGGQVLSLCRDAAQSGANLPERVQKLCEYAAAATGCVYVFKLTEDDLMDVRFEDLYFQTSRAIPADRICARVEIPAAFVRADLRNIKIELYRARLEQGSLAARCWK